mmetsp:Transcript_94717/g.268126  ORF Transcript_94717/g.268126 Transcript_94717/m.268126 type:complete len:219 (+) Transcript_94717:156-812(+)
MSPSALSSSLWSPSMPRRRRSRRRPPTTKTSARSLARGELVRCSKADPSGPSHVRVQLPSGALHSNPPSWSPCGGRACRTSAMRPSPTTPTSKPCWSTGTASAPRAASRRGCPPRPPSGSRHSAATRLRDWKCSGMLGTPPPRRSRRRRRRTPASAKCPPRRKTVHASRIGSILAATRSARSTTRMICRTRPRATRASLRRRSRASPGRKAPAPTARA